MRTAGRFGIPAALRTLREVRLVVRGARCTRLAALSPATVTALRAIASGAAVFGAPARILVRLVITGTRFRTRRMRAFLDFELRRRHEFDLALEHFLDVAQQSHLIRARPARWPCQSSRRAPCDRCGARSPPARSAIRS